MRTPTAITLATLTLLLTLTLLTPAQATESTITIKTLDNQPLQGAFVEILEGSTEVANGTTNSQGKVTLDINRTKQYTLKVYYPPGNLVYEKNDFNYSEANQFNVDVIGKWTIIVKDHGGDIPIEGANVTIVYNRNDTIRFTGITDSSGEVKFGPLPVHIDSRYSITVIFRGETYEGEEVLNTLPIDNVRTTFNLPLYKVTVSVLDLDGLPVEGVTVSIKGNLDEEPISEDVSDENGKAVLTLVPQGSYYLIAKFKDFIVYQSDSRELSVTNDREFEISVNAIRLKISVYDADGTDLMAGPHLPLSGELRYGNILVDEATTTDGVLNFGHVPTETFKLRIRLGNILVYSADYEVSVDTADGSVNAKFYDVTLRVNSTGFANSSMLESLNGVMKVEGFEFPFELSGGEAKLKNLPASSNYVVEFYYGSLKVGEVEGVEVDKEELVLNIRPEGYRVGVQLRNLDDEPIPGKIMVAIPGGEIIASFDVNEDGVGSSALLLPLTYDLIAYYEGIEVARQSITLSSSQEIVIQAAVKDMILRILDLDSESTLTNVRVELLSDGFKRSGVSDPEGNILVENLPLMSYRIRVWYHGFKVMDDLLEIKPGIDLIELNAPGVLDVNLRFTDSSKNPLDGGLVRLEVGEMVVDVEVNENGEVRVSNLPNGTIYLTFLYKGKEVKVEPKEFEPKVDEAAFTFMANVHKLLVSVVKPDGKPLTEGVATIYVEGVKVGEQDLSEDNIVEARLPEGEITIMVEYKGRKVAEKTVYLDTPSKEMSLETRVHEFSLNLVLPSGEPVSGAIIRAEDEKGVVDETASGENGYAEMTLPQGEYLLKITANNNTLEYPLNLKEDTVSNIIFPSEVNEAFFMTLSAAAINLAIMGLVIAKLVSKSVPRRRRPAPTRRIPRI